MKNNKPLMNRNLPFVAFTLLLAIYFITVINISLYKELNNILGQLDNVKIGFILSIPFFFLAIFNLLFTLFTWPKFSKPFFIIITIISSVVSYASYNYGILFDQNMIVNIVETDNSEATSYLSTYSAIWVLLMGGIPSLLIFKAPLPKRIKLVKLVLAKIVSILVSIAVIGVIASLYYQDYASVGRNNTILKRMIIPNQFISSTVGYIKKSYFSEPIPYKKIALDAKQITKLQDKNNTKPTLIVFVVGETARSQNYQANGYPRPTNQYTQDLDMVSFQDVDACGTATAVSVPCMFSALTHHTFDRNKADNQDNLLDILQRANISLLWKENDGGDKDVAKRINKVSIDRSRKDAVCNGNTCYDIALLENFEQNVDDLAGNRMIAMHLIGSHGPTYYQRYPQDKATFQPDCPRADIENCSIEEIVNTYDNTILYTDYVISQTVAKLKSLQDRYNTALIYISDHGESLGENGIFLHGLPYSLAPEYQTKVPLMVWMSPSFKESKNVNYDCLQRRSQLRNSYSHDNIFHSVLGIMDIETKEYNKTLDLFSLCRTS